MASNCFDVNDVAEEDCLEYCIYWKCPEITPLEMMTKCFDCIRPQLSSHIWNRDSFLLCPRSNPDRLEGRIRHGECVDDEWFAVSLLLELSRLLDGNVAVRARDGDGEFLLIEAADRLPRWLNPDTASGRVFLRGGRLHVVPVARHPGQITYVPGSAAPAAHDAVASVLDLPGVTAVSDDVQAALDERLEASAATIDTNRHFAHALLPQKVAALLRDDGRLVTRAVRAFYERDQSDLAHCRAMRFFPPVEPVKTRLQLTRTLYSILCSQKYVPDKKSGWKLSPPNSEDYCKEILGVKITCGFEILASRADKQRTFSGPFSGVRWDQFLTSLKKKNYFRGLLEGSKDYNGLLEDAKKFFLDSFANKSVEDVAGDAILEKLSSVDFSKCDFPESYLLLLPEDDTSWMELTPDRLETLLEEAFKIKSEMGRECGDDGEGIPGEIQKFLQTASSFKGVEEVEGAKGSSRTEEGDIDFDADEFSRAVEKMLGFSKGNVEIDEDSSDDGSEDESLEREGDGEMEDYMGSMDRELLGTNAASDLAESTRRSDEDVDKPLDVDAKVLKNLLESYKSQFGMPGPTATLLNSAHQFENDKQ